MATPELKLDMLRALLERPGHRMSSWPFQDGTVPNEDQYEALVELIEDAPNDVRAFEGSPWAEPQQDGTSRNHKPNNVRLTPSGIQWAREHLSQELGGSWHERSRNYLEALRAMDSDDRRQSVAPRAFDNGMAVVSWLLQSYPFRYVLSLFSFVAGVTEGLTRSTSKNFFLAYVWRALKIVLAIKLALLLSSLWPFGGDGVNGGDLARSLLQRAGEVLIRFADQTSN